MTIVQKLRSITKWVVWVGGVKSSRTPVSFFGHRLTFYGWGGNLRLWGRWLVWAREGSWKGAKWDRVYWSSDATHERGLQCNLRYCQRKEALQ